MTGQRFRQRKLSTKQNLAITRETDLDVTSLVEDDAQRHVPKVDTGVEKAEETEHHLQAAMAAAASGQSQLSIPTPETKLSALNYNTLYPPKFSQPATYIRFSSTVEDSTGSPYCMTAEDDVFLKNLNRKRSKQSQCSEDQFEELMSSFEATAQLKQPFATIDNPPVVTLEDMELSFDETVSDGARIFARDIYTYWKDQRLKHSNRPLMPSLKFETGQETDDSDPYVCFRRREVRQVRKTRGRDAQVTEKLKKLRRELEDARVLLHNVRQREYLKRDQLAIDREIFEQRSAVKDTKRKLGIKGDEEDLVNQKPSPKPKPQLTGPTLHRGMIGRGLKPQLTRADGRPPDLDLISLQETKARKEEEITRFIDESLLRHQNWNKGWVDITWRPITPPMEQSAQKSSFRPAITEFLPSPPPSNASDENQGDSVQPPQLQQQQLQQYPQRPTSSSGETVQPRGTFTDNNGAVTVCYASPPSETFDSRPRAPSFRRRVARGGRLVIERRGVKRSASAMQSPPPSATSSVCAVSPTRRQQAAGSHGTDGDRFLDRFKYDVESEEEEDTVDTDPFDTQSLRYRVALFGSSRRQISAEDMAAMQQQHHQLQQAAMPSSAPARPA